MSEKPRGGRAHVKNGLARHRANGPIPREEQKRPPRPNLLETKASHFGRSGRAVSARSPRTEIEASAGFIVRRRRLFAISIFDDETWPIPSRESRVATRRSEVFQSEHFRSEIVGSLDHFAHALQFIEPRTERYKEVSHAKRYARESSGTSGTDRERAFDAGKQ